MILAYNWDILGDERRQRWPCNTGEKRGLRVCISSWVGAATGARHVYAEVKEEDNQWWSEKVQDWVELSCDTSSSGYSMKVDVVTIEEAVTMAAAFIRLVAGDKAEHHRISVDAPDYETEALLIKALPGIELRHSAGVEYLGIAMPRTRNLRRGRISVDAPDYETEALLIKALPGIELRHSAAMPRTRNLRRGRDN